MHIFKRESILVLAGLMSLCDANQFVPSVIDDVGSQSEKTLNDVAKALHNQPIEFLRNENDPNSLERLPLKKERRTKLHQHHPAIRNGFVRMSEAGELSWCNKPLSRVPYEIQEKIRLLIRSGDYRVRVVFHTITKYESKSLRLDSSYIGGCYLKWKVINNNQNAQ